MFSLFLIPQLVPRVVRATPWVGFLPSAVIAMAMAWVATRQPTSDEHRLMPTRLAILAIVIAASFAFDDPAAPITDPAPISLRWRRLIRATTSVILAGVLISAVMLLAATDMDLVLAVPAGESADGSSEVAQFPGGRVALEAATMIGFSFATAAFMARRGEQEPGRIAAAVLLGAYAVSWMFPDSHKPWASPSDQRWETVAAWWWLALGLTVAASAYFSWDARTGRSLALFRFQKGSKDDRPLAGAPR